MNFIKSIFIKPDAVFLAKLELADAERDLLVSQSAVEYATSMASYNNNKIRRLQKYIADNSFKSVLLS